MEAFFQRPFMRRLARQYPRVINFIHDRLSPDHFFGLPLTILLLVAGLNVAMLTELAEHVVNSEATKALDIQVSGAVFNMRSPWLSKAFYVFTQLGSIYGVAAMFLLTSLYLCLKGAWQYLTAFLVAVLGSALSMDLLKEFFHRERPLHIAYYPTESSFSFPSGHATSAMALMGILCYFCLIHIENKRIRILLFCLGITYILLIGLSRIYLGVHFLTDVAAGFILGFLWVLLAIGVFEYLTIEKLRKATYANPL
ncbi:MAG: phosphatase PAP2 family protein [Adhaeribacter sp.]